MGNVFDITPEELDSAANEIETKSLEFTREYGNIYTASSDLKSKYIGEASDAFSSRLEGYRDDFQAVEKMLSDYVQRIRKYSTDMKETERRLVEEAINLQSV